MTILPESEIEQILVEALRESAGDYRLVAARSGVQVEEAGDPGVVTVAVGARAHDSFSLPTLNFSGSVAVVTRRECDTDGAKHDAVTAAVFSFLSRLHDFPGELATLFAAASFRPAAIRLDGGAMPDLANGIIADSINFTLRGVIVPPAPES